MTSTFDRSTTPTGLLPTKARDGRTMVGHAVVSHGHDEQANDAVAVWHVDTGGASTGAWVYQLDLDAPDPTTANRVLQLCLQRAVVAWRPSETVSVLAQLAHAANVAMPAWADTAVTVPEALEQIAATRTAYEKHMTEMSFDRNTTPIEWPIELPEHIPPTFDEMWQATRLNLTAPSPVTRTALMTGALVRWTVQRWQETMTTLSRRRYLRDAFGPQRVLPPDWGTRLADAYDRHRVLS
jgi:hypothetical protein